MKKNIPRILLTAPASGAGKTMITCGLLQCLKERKMQVTAFKCGPDYIDPMFHREVLGIDSYNLDTFLCGRDCVPKLLSYHAGQSEIAVMEGAMGYYDGLAGISAEASAYDIADVTDTPAVLIVNGRGTSLSVIPYIQGFLKFREGESGDSHIKGIILNHVSGMQYTRLKKLIESQTGVRVYGYVPEMEDVNFESRYLGLKMPKETEKFKEKIRLLGERFEETLDISGLIKLAGSASTVEVPVIKLPVRKYKVRIGLTWDQAFCFYYKDNLELLEAMGAEIVRFSPLYNTKLPDEIDGLILCGGYPELYAQWQEANYLMQRAIRERIREGMPCIAECGGFMYLQESIEGRDGYFYKAVGALDGKCFRTDSLQRFGYITLEGGTVFGRDVGQIPAHEFHYYDSEKPGKAFRAKKPLSERSWECMISTDTLLAGYPHIHYAGNPKVAEAFLEACTKRRK